MMPADQIRPCTTPSVPATSTGAAGAISTAGRDEWEVFESRYAGGVERWLLAHPDHADATAIRAAINAHRASWIRAYRDILGFAYLVLAAT